MRLISVKQCSIHVSRARYMVEKNLKNYMFISTKVKTSRTSNTAQSSCLDYLSLQKNVYELNGEALNSLKL